MDPGHEAKRLIDVTRAVRLSKRLAKTDRLPHVAARLEERVAGRLAALGVRDPHVDVETCDALERPAAGKLQLVVADS